MNEFYCFRKYLILILIPFFLILTQCSKPKESISSLAPDFRLNTIDAQEITLSGLKGKVVLLDFWATWCGPCRESIPHFIELYKNYHGKNFELIGMNMDKKSEIEMVRKFVNSTGIPYPIIITSEEVIKSYGVNAIPTSILIDKNGKIREKIVGFNKSIARHTTNRIEELLSEP